jgi:glycine/D-amino acid oxidase-like deaminating enzyme
MKSMPGLCRHTFSKPARPNDPGRHHGWLWFEQQRHLLSAALMADLRRAWVCGRPTPDHLVLMWANGNSLTVYFAGGHTPFDPT